MRQLLGFALRRLGDVSIFEAGDGLEGLKIIQSEQIDVALIDINMPIMDGFKLIKHIRQDPQLKNLPIIIITTEGRPESVEKAKGLGVNHYITKPIRQSEVVETVRGFLKTR
jgi:two-component system chemotaxis response regulator CheY